jgi:hypothetical protein
VIAIAVIVIWFALNGVLWYAKLGEVPWLIGSLGLAAAGYPVFFWYVTRGE